MPEIISDFWVSPDTFRTLELAIDFADNAAMDLTAMGYTITGVDAYPDVDNPEVFRSYVYFQRPRREREPVQAKKRPLIDYIIPSVAVGSALTGIAIAVFRKPKGQ